MEGSRYHRGIQPFSQRHQYHINESRRLSSQSGVIAYYEGFFVQRGEPAIVDKWCRAHMAIVSGVDLVLETATVFALRSASILPQDHSAACRAWFRKSRRLLGAEESDMAKLSSIYPNNQPQTGLTS